MSGSHHKRELLGAGVCATVYAEWDFLLGSTVAVKELESPFAEDPLFARAFLARAESLLDIESRHVLAIYRADGGRRKPAVVRELADETLEAPLLAGPLSPGDVEEILRQTLLGLQAMHGRGVAHGGVKPQNLFRCGDRYKIGDFGVAHVAAAGAPGPPGMAAVRASRYTAPELLRGEPATPAADLYSLGLVAYELLLGRRRFEELVRELVRRAGGLDGSVREDTDVLMQSLHAAAVDLPSLHGFPTTIAQAVQRMLQRVPEERARNAGDLLEALGGSGLTGMRSAAPTRLGTSVGASAFDARLRPPPKPPLEVPKLKSALAIAVGALLAVSTVFAVLFLRSQRPSEGRLAIPRPTPMRAAAGTAAAQPSPTVRIPPLPAPSSPQSPLAVGALNPSPPPTGSPQPVAPAKQTLPATALATPRTPLTAGGKNRRAAPPIAPGGARSAVANGSSPAEPSTRTVPTMDPPEPEPSQQEIIRDIQPSRYRLGWLRGSQSAYVDVEASYAEVPDHAKGLPCIATANSDRFANSALSFTLDRGAKVYVGYDHSLKNRPGWLQEFTETGETWSVLTRDAAGVLSGRIDFDVFSRSYPAGTVTLGPNIDKGGFFRRFGKVFGRREPSMYLVCADGR